MVGSNTIFMLNFCASPDSKGGGRGASTITAISVKKSEITKKPVVHWSNTKFQL